MSAAVVHDDFSREVYCILGVPIDAISLAGLVERIHRAASGRQRLFLSTTSNFFVRSQRDPDLRASLLVSDLCPADGAGVLLFCRMLGFPISARVAG